MKLTAQQRLLLGEIAGPLPFAVSELQSVITYPGHDSLADACPPKGQIGDSANLLMACTA